MTLSDLSSCLGAVKGYGEARLHQNTNLRMTMVGGNLVANSRSSSGGVSARVYSGGSWGMASAPEKTAEALNAAVSAANRNAEFLGSKTQKTAYTLNAKTGRFEKILITSKPRFTAAQKLDFLRTLDDYIANKYPALSSRTLSIGGIDMDKMLVTTDGALSHTFIPRVHLYILMTADRDGSPVELMATPIGGLGEFEDFFQDPADYFNEADKLYELVMKKREGISPEAGLKTCILAPDLAGILAHEAVGHTVEYDLVKGGSIAGPMLNNTVASEKISITDFAHTAFGETCPVPVFCDDEGVEAKDAVLIENGILKGYMHSRLSASEFGTQPEGNARAFSFDDEPLIRMRNTCILPGHDKLEDMIASVEDGYYLSHPSNGQADLTSEFMFGVSMGYEIKNGKLGKALLDTTVSGVAFEMLKTVTHVSDDMEWVSSGFCGKKQPMSVGMGGPAILCKINIGGK